MKWIEKLTKTYISFLYEDRKKHINPNFRKIRLDIKILDKLNKLDELIKLNYIRLN